VRLRLISADELLRRMQDRLARARLNANRLVELQREKQRRVGELVDALDPAESLATGDILAINAAAVGQRRVQNDASTLARDLASVAQELIYARLDDKSSGLLEFLDVRLAQVEDTAFHSELWIELTDAFEGGELGAPGFTGNLVSLVDHALSVSAEAALLAAQDIDRAQQATNGEARLNALFAAYENQTVSVHRIEALLESLAEWDNFQNVLALTRDILNRQKALRDRTRRFAKENE
jgi:hypothetical protein